MMAASTLLVISLHEDDCRGLKMMLNLVFVQHILNALMAMLNLTPIPRKFCTCMGVWVFLLIELTTIIYTQVIYFRAMPSDIDFL